MKFKFPKIMKYEPYTITISFYATLTATDNKNTLIAAKIIINTGAEKLITKKAMSNLVYCIYLSEGLSDPGKIIRSGK